MASDATTVDEITYGDTRRAWQQQFIEYMNRIVDHPNYAGMPYARDEQGKIDWIIPSNRPKGSKNWDGNERRRDWWRQQAERLGIPQEGTWPSKVARQIHPFGEKPCQVCGRIMKLAYTYPKATTLGRLNARLNAESQIEPEQYQSIQQIATALWERDPAQARAVLGAVFRELVGAEDLKEVLARLDLITAGEDGRFSPGAMANPPDRLDGFHTYNRCCRPSQDTGRFIDNLRTYGVDRRAYIQWCEGDWAAADALMKRVGRGVCPRPNCQSGGGVVKFDRRPRRPDLSRLPTLASLSGSVPDLQQRQGQPDVCGRRRHADQVGPRVGRVGRFVAGS